MKKFVLFILFVSAFGVASLFLFPGNTEVIEGFSITAPRGWVVIKVDVNELRIQPRVGLWGVGVVLVKKREQCSSEFIEKLKINDIVKEPVWEDHVFKGWTWSLTSFQSDGALIYKAYSLLPDAKCIRVLGDPKKVVYGVMNQFAANKMKAY